MSTFEEKKFKEQKNEIERYRQYAEPGSIFKGDKWPKQLKDIFLESLERAEISRTIKERDCYIHITIKIFQEIASILFCKMLTCPKCGTIPEIKNRSSGLFIPLHHIYYLVMEDNEIMKKLDLSKWLIKNGEPYIQCDRCGYLYLREEV